MIRLILDNSGGEAVIAADRNGELLFQVRRAFTIRESGGLAAWVNDVLRAERFDLNAVDEWLCGTGPGSFSGLRAAGAIVSGLVRGMNKGELKGVPSALGIASVRTPEEDNLHAAVLYDGRNGELLYLGLTSRDKRWWPSDDNGVIETASLPALASRFSCLFSLEANRLLMNGREDIIYAPHIDASALLSRPYRMSPTELIYLRPAVFVSPRPVRQVV